MDSAVTVRYVMSDCSSLPMCEVHITACLYRCYQYDEADRLARTVPSGAVSSTGGAKGQQTRRQLLVRTFCVLRQPSRAVYTCL